MGTDINAAFGHGSEFPPTETLARSMCAGIKPVSPIFQNNWSLSDFSYLRLVRVHCSGLAIYFGPRAAIVSTGFSWPHTTADHREAQMVASAVSSIARFFRSPQVIFLPDDIEPWCDVDRWISEGASIEEVRMRLAQIKGPATGFSGTIKQSPECWEVDGYFVEELSYDRA